MYNWIIFLKINDMSSYSLMQQIKALLKQIECYTQYCIFSPILKQSVNLELSEKILARLEKRWNSWEQPLLILACLLHPGEFNDFSKKLYPFDDSTFNQFKKGGILSYWTFIIPLTNKLGLVAC
ncbi:23002_t:CDS:2 [Gigaspora rosea]|nr:23002_t:CDS:2 [Gigaspora rosea]